MIIVLGKNSFIAKHLLIQLLSLKKVVKAMSHKEALDSDFEFINDGDTIISCCGVNRSDTLSDYEQGNYGFIASVLDKISKDVFIVYLSSLMIFMETNRMNEHYQAFVRTKLQAEEIIKTRIESYLIIRPCNLYGLLCKPFYNNIIVSLIHDICHGEQNIKTLNKNSYRYFMNINNFCTKLVDMILSKTIGTYNILTTVPISLQEIHQILYQNVTNNVPTLFDGQLDQLDPIEGNNIYLDEDYAVEFNRFKQEYNDVLNLYMHNKLETLPVHNDVRGQMIEVSSMLSRRLYIISVYPGAIRGNHFHYEQMEEFYVLNGEITVLLRHAHSNGVVIFYLKANDRLLVTPPYIHTFINTSFQECRIIVSSTQPYISNEVPDTEYVSVFAY